MFNLKERSHYEQTQAEHRRRSHHYQAGKRQEDEGTRPEEGRRQEIDSSDKKELVSRLLRNAALWEIKVLPMFASLMVISTLFLSYFDLDVIYANIIEEIYYIGVMILFFTLSYLFKFCGYHRLFIWYIVVNHYIGLIDTHYTIPLGDRDLLIFYLIIAGVFSFFILRNYLKHKPHESK